MCILQRLPSNSSSLEAPPSPDAYVIQRLTLQLVVVTEKVVGVSVFAAEEIDVVIERYSRHFLHHLFNFPAQNRLEGVEVRLLGRVSG